MADEFTPTMENLVSAYAWASTDDDAEHRAADARRAIAAHDRTERASALEEAALEADEWQQSHDAAEIAGHVEGETGRQAAIDRWIGLCEDPAAWLRNRAERGE